MKQFFNFRMADDSETIFSFVVLRVGNILFKSTTRLAARRLVQTSGKLFQERVA